MSESTVYNLPIEDLPEGSVPLSALVVVQILDENGEGATCLRWTDGQGLMERLGMATFARLVTEDETRDAAVELPGWDN